MKRVNSPKSQLEISSGKPNVIDRSQQIRRDNDKVRDYTTGIYDIDFAIQYYIKNVIKPTIVENGELVTVPVMYGTPEQWTSIRKMSYLRDKKGKMLVPLIAYIQTGGAKNTEIPVDKLDANNPHLFYTYGQKWSKKNQYTNFNALSGETPVYELFRIIVPDYINFTYEVIIWTAYIEQMNKIIESIVYSEGAYWGEEERSKFRTTINDYSKTVEISQGNDRYCQVSMTLTVYGYIIPDSINKQLSMKNAPQKVFTNSKILFGMETDLALPVGNLYSIGAPYTPDTITTINKSVGSAIPHPISFDNMTLNNITLAGDTNITGSLTIVGPTTSSGSITIISGSSLIGDIGDIDLGYY